MRASNISVALLMLTSALLLPLMPNASATPGDVLYDPAGAPIVPGNPCNAQGPDGGVAVDQARGRLYYSTRDDPVIYNASTTAPFACAPIPVPAVLPGMGFRKLAFDASTSAPYARGIVWAVIDDNSARVLGIDVMTGNVVSSFHMAGVTTGTIEAIASENVTPFRNFAVLSGSTVAQTFTDAGAYLVGGDVQLGGLLGDTRGLATWDNALLAGDNAFALHVQDMAGKTNGVILRPHADYVDQFFQVQQDYAPYSWDDVAVDSVSYMARNLVALFTIQGDSTSSCALNCPGNPCVKNCTTTGCTSRDSEGRCIFTTYCDGVPGAACTGPEVRQVTCDGVPGACTAPPVYAINYRITLRAHQILDSKCPKPLAPCGTPPCTPPPAAAILTRTAPKDLVYVENVATAALHSPTLAYGDKLTVNFTDAAGTSGKRLDIIGGGLPSLPLTLTPSANGKDWVGTLDLSMAAGAYPLTAIESSLVDPCVPPTAVRFTVIVAKPYLFSHAQNVRVSGNLPADIMAGTPSQDALQKLLGREFIRIAGTNATVAAPPSALATGQASGGAQSLVALAEHAPLTTRPSSVNAHSFTETQSASEGPIAGNLCPPPSFTCNPYLFPAAGADLTLTEANATVDVDTLASTASATSSLVNGQPIPCAFLCTGSLTMTPPGSTITWTAGETWTNKGLGFAESYASFAHATIDLPPWKGEIILGESYAVSSMVGVGPLLGLPHFMENPDDYQTGADAPARAGPSLPSGTYSGQFVGTDRVDSFRISVASVPSVKLQVVLSEAHRVEDYASPLPTAPSGQATLRLMNLTLIDPYGVVRDASASATQTLNARPVKVELNVDVPGDWTVLVQRVDVGRDHADYGIAVALTPLVYQPWDASPLDPPTDSDCTTNALPARPFTGWLGPGEAQDTWSVTLAAQQGFRAAMKPALDADGADFDLYLMDPGCQHVVAFSVTRGTEVVPKGTPESLAYIAPVAGTYTLVITRVNGIGNYAVATAADVI